MIGSPVLQRYVVGAVFVAIGLLFSVLSFELQDIDVLSRLVEASPSPTIQMSRIAIGSRADISIAGARQMHREGAVRSAEPMPGPNGTHRVVVAFPNPGGYILTGQAADIAIRD